jgi:hypothetical protein
MKLTKFEKVSRGLSKIRSKNFPKCATFQDLHEILKNNETCRETYANFRGRNFYQDMLKVGRSTASVFVCEQIAQQIGEDTILYVDGTFGILPLKFKQMLVVMADVAGKVRKKLEIN